MITVKKKKTQKAIHVYVIKDKRQIIFGGYYFGVEVGRRFTSLL